MFAVMIFSQGSVGFTFFLLAAVLNYEKAIFVRVGKIQRLRRRVFVTEQEIVWTLICMFYYL